MRAQMGGPDNVYALRDAFRALYPDLKEYTRTGHHGRLTTWRRLDRIMVSPSTVGTSGALPRAERVDHIRPTDAQMLALRSTGSTSKWSDHAAVQLTMRYTNTRRPPKEI